MLNYWRAGKEEEVEVKVKYSATEVHTRDSLPLLVKVNDGQHMDSLE